jgi:hypothetical protein
MIYVLRDSQGRITKISESPKSNEWQECQEGNKELQLFLQNNPSATKDIMRSVDADFIRVLEDVIDLLINKEIIKFTDFPVPVQNKLLKRRKYRNVIKQNPDASILLDSNVGLL